MNPYTSLWTGVAPGDGPQEFHVVLLDNGRTNVLADEVGRQTLACIRCSACLNVCPVYERTGGHAYGSVYPGPIGAILTPQLVGTAEAGSLPFASSLCGACAEVCPVKIDIPQVLVHLRGRVVRERRSGVGERTAMAAAARTLRSPWRFRWGRRRGSVGSAAVREQRQDRTSARRTVPVDVNARPTGHAAALVPRLVEDSMTPREVILSRIAVGLRDVPVGPSAPKTSLLHASTCVRSTSTSTLSSCSWSASPSTRRR